MKNWFCKKQITCACHSWIKLFQSCPRAGPWLRFLGAFASSIVRNSTYVDSLLSTAAKHSTFYLVKVSFDLVRQLRLRSPLLPRRVPSEHFGHPLVGGERAQFEALHEEEILKLDLEIHSIRILWDRFQAVRVAETCRPCKTEHQIRGRITMNS